MINRFKQSVLFTYHTTTYNQMDRRLYATYFIKKITNNNNYLKKICFSLKNQCKNWRPGVNCSRLANSNRKLASYFFKPSQIALIFLMYFLTDAQFKVSTQLFPDTNAQEFQVKPVSCLKCAVIAITIFPLEELLYLILRLRGTRQPRKSAETQNNNGAVSKLKFYGVLCSVTRKGNKIKMLLK